ncbi:MAG: hypothetical protein II297_00365, partial [Clostridia bacterium]|nr:hypothetical protein [Clostridia bacterium]
DVLFEIITPISKKETKTERESHDLKHFCKYNKTTGAVEVLLTLGLPGEDEFEFKKGCVGKKKVTMSSTVKRIPRPTAYKRTNVAAVGSVFGAQSEEQGVEGVTALPSALPKSLAGCQGCNSLLKKR